LARLAASFWAGFGTLTVVVVTVVVATGCAGRPASPDLPSPWSAAAARSGCGWSDQAGDGADADQAEQGD